MMNGIEIFANMILKEACRVQASDLHIVPEEGCSGSTAYRKRFNDETLYRKGIWRKTCFTL